MVAQDAGAGFQLCRRTLPEIGLTRVPFAHHTKRTWERRKGLDSADAGHFPGAARRCLVDVLVVGSSIANDAANQILSLGALIRIQQEFLLIEQICLFGHWCVKAILL